MYKHIYVCMWYTCLYILIFNAATFIESFEFKNLILHVKQVIESEYKIKYECKSIINQ